MKAAIVQGAGQAPRHGDFPEPSAETGEQHVRVSAAALNPLSRARASGTHYSSSGQFPFIAGVDGTGRLDDGRRVYFLLPRTPYGSMAEETVVAQAHCCPLPDALDAQTAAAIANPGMSSWAALSERARFKAGETVLINGATGASGQLAVQIARHRGASRVIATGRDVGILEQLDADIAIPLTDDGDALEARFKTIFAEGVDVVLDYLWGMSAERLLIAGAKAGAEAVPIRFVQIGTASGADIPLPGALLRSSAIELMGSGIGSITLSRLVTAVKEMLEAAIPGRFTLPFRAVPLSDLDPAWAENARERIVFNMG
ncbi:MAG TPA: zinc-binding alcohol dehydrogenase family protein [Sphingobium sp.]|uniref:quinone oxidoreductase family protein n=1 Tax=Sphingobium sp. TaxID=1912891 RepID=UPI002ED54802